jgi:sulfide dehydrogenase [flavocytochrome c] flavoprotein chain
VTSTIPRRDFLRTVAAAASVAAIGGLAGCRGRRSRARVVVVGAGFGGATLAKYLRLWDPAIEVTLVERQRIFTSCPVSNLVIGGHRTIDELQHGYTDLAGHGVRVVHDDASAVYPDHRMVRLAGGGELVYDRLVLSPGIDFVFDDDIPGCQAAIEGGRVLHAWKAGSQTTALRERLTAMNDGGVYGLVVPPMPYRCPPGPYERVCQVASFFKQAKPRAKILVFDANLDVVSKGPLFKQAWADLYPGMIEYVPDTRITAVDGAAMAVRIGEDTVRADVLNLLPRQRAGDLAWRAGLVPPGERWCPIEWRSCESLVVPHVHVIGDATLSAPGMPKSGHMANSQAKICAAALVAVLNDRSPNQDPLLNNACFSYVSATEAIHVASVHRWDAERNTVIPVPEAAGVSPARSEREAADAWSWARNIWTDMLS